MDILTEPQRLIEPLPPGHQIHPPTAIDRLWISIGEDGHVAVRGPREVIEEFIARCAAEGVLIELESLVLCG